MSTRPQVKPMYVIEDGDMSANITSAVTILSQLSMCSYTFAWEGTSLDGTITIEVSNDYKITADGKGVENPGTWVPLYFSVNGVLTPSMTVDSDSGSGFADIDQTAAYAIRTVYTFSAGTGELQAIFNGKVQ